MSRYGPYSTWGWLGGYARMARQITRDKNLGGVKYRLQWYKILMYEDRTLTPAECGMVDALLDSVGC